MSKKIFLTIVVVVSLILYLQVAVLRGFNENIFKNEHVTIELSPQSQSQFGGFSYGFMRLDSKDELYLGIIANIGAGKKADISFLKDGNTYRVQCKADTTGICYEAIHEQQAKLSGDFTCVVAIDNRSFKYAGRFERRTEFISLLREALLSV
jgi:hypothetical protein